MAPEVTLAVSGRPYAFIRPADAIQSGVPVSPPSQTPSSQGSAVTPGGGNLRWQFQSPTGNIACDLNGSATPRKPPAKSASTPTSPRSSRLAIRAGRTVSDWCRAGQCEVNCYSGTDFRSALPVQGYGKPLTVGSLTCVLDETTGVTCKDGTTGHFFRAARQAYEWR